MGENACGGSRSWLWRVVAASSAAIALMVVVAAAPAGAAPPPKQTITRISDTFTCLNTDIGFVGGGTLTALVRRTAVTPLEG